MKNLKKLFTLILIAALSFSMITYAKAEEDDEITTVADNDENDESYSDEDNDNDEDAEDTYVRNQVEDKNKEAIEGLESGIAKFINSKSKVKVYSKTKMKSKEVLKYIYNVKSQALTGKIDGKYKTVKLSTKDFVSNYITDSANLGDVLDESETIKVNDDGFNIKVRIYNDDASNPKYEYINRKYGKGAYVLTAYRVLTGFRTSTGIQVNSLKAASLGLVTAFEYSFNYVD